MCVFVRVRVLINLLLFRFDRITIKSNNFCTLNRETSVARRINANRQVLTAVEAHVHSGKEQAFAYTHNGSCNF